MRIKKILGTVGLVGNILNKKSISKKDAYSCDYINKLNDYSTSEQRIGTWIDDKPLYRRVYNCGTLTAVGTITIPTGLSNVNYIDWTGVAIFENGGSTGWPYKMSTGSSPSVVGLDILGDEIRIQAVADLSSYTGYVTILYTKNN